MSKPKAKLLELETVWKVDADGAEHKVDVVIDWDHLMRTIRYTAIRAARSSGGRVGFNHKMIVATRREEPQSMAKKSKEKQMARALQEALDCSYMVALNALRACGGDYEAAHKKLSDGKGK